MEIVKKNRVLYIDRTSELRNAMARNLSAFGFEVTALEMTRESEVLSRLRQAVYDLLLINSFACMRHVQKLLCRIRSGAAGEPAARITILVTAPEPLSRAEYVALRRLKASFLPFLRSPGVWQEKIMLLFETQGISG